MKIDKFNKLLADSSNIVVIQADNPDGDSLASALALEAALDNIGKNVTLFCGVDIPTYLRHIPGWDRVVNELPKIFDLSIIVDTSAISLLDSLVKSSEINWVKTKPVIIIDHHASEPTIDFSTEIINVPASSTGEILYGIFQANKWSLDTDTAEKLATSILFDTMGLTSESVSANTLSVLSDLVGKGVVLAKLEERRRESNKKSIGLVKYKAKLLERVSVDIDSRIATVDITWPEIEKYSHLYNPPMLVMDEMRMIEGVEVAIAFKTYPDGKITGKIRANYGIKIADKLAENFGGGGHPYAAGFKMNKAENPDKIKRECIEYAGKLLDELRHDKNI